MSIWERPAPAAMETDTYIKGRINVGKEAKTNAMRMLEKQKIPFTSMAYECEEFVDGMDTARRLGLSPEQTFKTLVTVGKSKEYYVFVIPIGEELDLKKAAKAVGEKSVEMIPVKDITRVTGYVRGGCTAIGMKKQYPTVLHESALEQETIWVSGGRIGLQLRLSPQDYIKAAEAKCGDIIQK